MAKSKTYDFGSFTQALAQSGTEEDVKSLYAQHFDLKYNTKDRHDLYTPEVLFEFKYEAHFETRKNTARVLAQMLYYVRRLKFGLTDKRISSYLCLADKKAALLLPTALWKEFYTDPQDLYDWDLTPSNPDTRLIADLAQSDKLKNAKVFSFESQPDYEVFYERLSLALKGTLPLEGFDKKLITEENFESVFVYWNQIFGDSVRNGFKTSRYFVSDIQQGNTIFLKEQSKAFFRIGQSGEIKEKKIFAKDYEYFWEIYERVQEPAVMRSILAKIDRLTDETMRRFHGEFFTPLPFAQKTLEYIEKTLGKAWWKTGKYRLWDMAAGTGNLEYHLPTEALPFCYLSTLYKEDVEHCEKLFPKATIFQYDYLNDDVGNVFLNGSAHLFNITWKLPEKLRQDLADPNLTWIILINPPFATSSLAGTNETNKAGVSDTKLRKMMHKENLGEVSRELFAQFLYRIKYEFDNKKTFLGLFSTLKYLNSNNDQKFRDTIFQFKFENGFAFSSANFSGTSKASPFPVGFLLWNLAEQTPIEKQELRLDVFNHQVEKIGVKEIVVAHRSNFLNKWIKRPKGIKKFPPFSSGITIKPNTKDVRDRISENFIASLMCASNDLQHQNFTALLSGPYVSAGSLSIEPDNFEKAMVVHAVRRLPKATWLNDRDQFMQPQKEVPLQFILDATVWNLYCNSNQTVALKNINYKNEIYQIENHFFPFLKAEISQWKISDSDVRDSLLAHSEERFMAQWLEKNKTQFSKEALAVLAAGKALWQFYFERLNELNTPKFKIQTWDAGYWQVRNALADQNIGEKETLFLKQKHNLLKAKLLPQVYELGFLAKENLEY
ncbi:hypothetical protein [Hugenholtzia roseola]|uniref:hypothetical protein n=1 Tax=Hugenholtzia roseola TaxID=1002 RepID=UPI0012B56931|nr:hypothetical protein [Hugenholtzia roseola]